MTHRVTYQIGDEELVLETGKMAKQANGAVFAQLGGSAVLATACCSDKEIEGLDYVPLQVEYNEKYYAAGKIPGGFIKRETRPKDKEILVSRLIDRPMRPLFYKEFARDIQVVPTVIATDQVNTPDIIAMIASAAAVYISDIPFNGPVAATRVAYVDDQLVINPSFDQIDRAEMDIIVAGTEEGITMVEGGAKEVSEELLLSAIEKAHPVIKDLCQIQRELKAAAGKEKLPLSQKTMKELENRQEIWDFAYDKIKEANFVKGKHNRSKAVSEVKRQIREHFADTLAIEENEKPFETLLEELETTIVRKSILEDNKRTDERSNTDIRPITCDTGILNRTHGSALFTRGETQALAITTLGSVFDEQILDNIDGDTREHFMLHYNFPPFSVGETGRLGTGRREIGHGHLAHRALAAVLPDKKDFPYTIRVVSEILESNGSSSMATVCGGSLALLDSGVPLKKPVAGIAMGLITDNSNSVVLSDILGEEDHLGDMDFKVAGTENGITAFQMDIKIANIDTELMKKALDQAKTGRMHILGIMNDTLSQPRSEISQYAPKIINLKVDQDKIGAIIGPGGKMVKSITEETDTTINIEDDGTVTIYAKNLEGAEAAEAKVRSLIEEPEVGRVYEGTVKRLMDFGAFIEILPGKEGLCHISKMSKHRIQSVDEVMKEGDIIPVKLIEIDRMGRLNLSYIDAIDPDASSQSGGTKKRDNGRHRDRRDRH
ncbi:MAG: polyribonucleotide nucleotidyltransferase [Spirochaetia bacterium]